MPVARSVHRQTPGWLSSSLGLVGLLFLQASVFVFSSQLWLLSVAISRKSVIVCSPFLVHLSLIVISGFHSAIFSLGLKDLSFHNLLFDR